MMESQKLTASDGVANDQFGVAVAISGNTLVVGESTPPSARIRTRGRPTCLGPLPAANSSLVGSGDFNGDGTTDLLWQNQSTGLVQVSLVKNATITNWVTLAYADPTQWKLAGTGNFTGNGTTDILWINTSNGEVGLWLINNATVTGWSTWPTSILLPGPSKASATSITMALPTRYGRTTAAWSAPG